MIFRPKRVRAARLFDTTSITIEGTLALLASRFELSEQPNRILAMEGMRGFAALIVFFVHFHGLFGRYVAVGSATWNASAFAAGFGSVGVDLFFVISGFLIYGRLASRPTDLRSFLWRRIQRLYPTFLVIFCLVFAGQLLLPNYSHKLPENPADAVGYVILNLLLLPGVIDIPAMVTVAWSLSYEMFFYAAAGLTAVVFRLRARNAQSRFAFFLAVSTALLWLGQHFLGHLARMTLFLAGILLWELMKGVKLIQRPPSLLEPVCIGLFGLMLFRSGLAAQVGDPSILSSGGIKQFPLLFVSSLLLTLYGFYGGGFLSRVFSADYLRWMGNMSYSFYLIHGFALQALRFLVDFFTGGKSVSSLAYVALFVGGLGAAIFSGAVLFLLIEKPYSIEVVHPTAPVQNSARAAAA